MLNRHQHVSLQLFVVLVHCSQVSAVSVVDNDGIYFTNLHLLLVSLTVESHYALMPGQMLLCWVSKSKMFSM